MIHYLYDYSAYTQGESMEAHNSVHHDMHGVKYDFCNLRGDGCEIEYFLKAGAVTLRYRDSGVWKEIISSLKVPQAFPLTPKLCAYRNHVEESRNGNGQGYHLR
jgi:hypothetical protein